MAVNVEAYKKLLKELHEKNVTLVAVSKTKPVEDILALYDLGQRDFGENYVQELSDKRNELPNDIRWHFIGHLQRNKVKHIASFAHLIHGVDSLKLLQEINKQAANNDRIINCLLQVHIAKEETKFGMNENELEEAFLKSTELKHVSVKGLMGMASFTDNMEIVRNEFIYLKSLYDKHTELSVLSMGMSADFSVAIHAGSNMVRIGSLLFGERNYNK